MKKMILMSILALSAGQLVGMEKPEPQTAQELRKAISAELKGMNLYARGGRVQRDFVNKIGVFLAARDDFDDFNDEIAHASFFTSNLIKAIEPLIDPKEGVDLSGREQYRLTKALEYLNRLKKLV